MDDVEQALSELQEESPPPEIDFAWSYVAGTADCIQQVSSVKEFETLPTRLEHGITYASDEINPPPLT